MRNALGMLTAVAILAGCSNDPLPELPLTPDAPFVIGYHGSDTTQASVRDDNLLPGDEGWNSGTPADPAHLAVWGSPYDLSRGDTLDLHIHSDTGRVRVEIYRIGDYGGVGARLMLAQGNVRVEPQPPCTPPFPGQLRCPWATAIRIVLDPTWPGGIYMARVRNHQNQVYSYPFVVRSRLPHTFFVVANQFTWQAYNNFGGTSLYTIDPSTTYTVPVVTFERPYGPQAGMMTVGGMEAGGSNDVPAVRWLERQGYDLGYISDADLADSSFTLPQTKALLFVGHDEYWTWSEYGRARALRDAGVHLAFFAGNSVYWNVRLATGPITGQRSGQITTYKLQADPSAPTPEQTTTKFRNPPLNKPENSLVGVEYSSLLLDGASPPYIVAADSLRGPEGMSFLGPTGLHAGDTLWIGAGNEGDQIINNGFGPTNLQVLFRAEQHPATGPTRVYHSTFYKAASGAGVWASASNFWASYLTDDRQTANPVVQIVTKQVLDWMASH